MEESNIKEVKTNDGVSADHRPAKASFINKPYLPYIIIFLFSYGIYFNTLWCQYANDDGAVLTGNKYTLKGLSGIKDIMTHDAFTGYFGEDIGIMVNGGRYRPLSIVTLAVEVHFFGLDPMVSHGVNMFLFALTCMFLYFLLRYMLPGGREKVFYLSVPFIAAMLYAGHPIHTEVVANIKGRDEIMSLLFSLLALYAGLLYVHSRKPLHIVWGAVVFFLALLSKENAITFIAVIPLTYYFFSAAKWKDYAVTLGIYILPVAAFLWMRHMYVPSGLWAESTEILNNPFALLGHDLHGYILRYATVVETFLLYFKLLIVPYPLTHDYYYDQVPFVGLTNLMFILSLLINGALLIYALMHLRSRSISAYSILFYYITFSVASNLLFTIGILMNERFVYMCSVGFCLLVAYLLVKAKERYYLPDWLWGSLLSLILLLYAVGTFSRNQAWRDSATILFTDSKTSTHSARMQFNVGFIFANIKDQDIDAFKANGELQRAMDILGIRENVSTTPNAILKKQIAELAIKYLKNAIAIYPGYYYAWYNLGNVSYKLNHDPAQAIRYYTKAEELTSGAYFEAWNDMGCVRLESNMYPEARYDFSRALMIRPTDATCMTNLAVAYTNMGMADSALHWYSQALILKPNDAGIYHKIGKLYGQQLHDLPNAIRYIRLAMEKNPNMPEVYSDLSLAYNLAGKPDDALLVSEECLRRFPAYTQIMNNMAVAYQMKKDTTKAREYAARAAASADTH